MHFNKWKIIEGDSLSIKQNKQQNKQKEEKDEDENKEDRGGRAMKDKKEWRGLGSGKLSHSTAAETSTEVS